MLKKFYLYKHGFVMNRSTVTNLIEITQFIHENTRNNKHVDVIYFDFSKAFDKVDSKIGSNINAVFIIYNHHEIYYESSIFIKMRWYNT